MGWSLVQTRICKLFTQSEEIGLYSRSALGSSALWGSACYCSPRGTSSWGNCSVGLSLSRLTHSAGVEGTVSLCLVSLFSVYFSEDLIGNHSGWCISMRPFLAFLPTCFLLSSSGVCVGVCVCVCVCVCVEPHS